MNQLKKMVKNKHVIGTLVAITVLGVVGVRYGAIASPEGTPQVNVEHVDTLNLAVMGGETATVGEDQGDVLGGLVHNIQERFNGGIMVNGSTVIGADRSVSSTNLYVSGNVTGNLPSVYVATMSSSATTTACTFSPPEDGTNRVVLAAWVEDTGSSASAGSVTWQAATGTTQYAITSTATKIVNTALTRSAATVITTTSTPQLTGYGQQRTSEYLNFISSTTTNSGYCYLLAR